VTVVEWRVGGRFSWMIILKERLLKEVNMKVYSAIIQVDKSLEMSQSKNMHTMFPAELHLILNWIVKPQVQMQWMELKTFLLLDTASWS